jgi:hypothetical protein
MMSERNEYITAMDAFRGLDAPPSPQAKSHRSKGSSMPPPSASRQQLKKIDSESFWDSSNLFNHYPLEHFKTGNSVQNHETVASISWMHRNEEGYAEDDDAHLFFGVTPSTTSNIASISSEADTPSDWANRVDSSLPQENWDVFPAPSFQPMNEKGGSTHHHELEERERLSNQHADLLHFTCAIQSNTDSKSFDVIEKLALRDLSAAHRRMSDHGKIIMQKAVIASNRKLPKLAKRSSWIKPRYTLPLNIAIQYNADPRVLELLIHIAPQVIQIPDGPELESSLHIAIKHHCSTESIDMMLRAMPSAAATRDRHSNTPLHAACLMRSEEDDLIRSLLLCHPGAAKERNFHAQTPLFLLQRSNRNVSESTLNLMQRRHCLKRSPSSKNSSRPKARTTNH